MNEDKVKNIISLSSKERASYFVRKVADFEEVWGLYSKAGWVTCATASGALGFPVWPESGFAALCAYGEWEETRPKKILLPEFLCKWLPGLSRTYLKIIVRKEMSAYNTVHAKTE
ncbi:MAG: DUF2750 domain-containing protein [Proteobacteria bacterium]|nr:DUF2750 domain-containing protein [Pseudomonadota bacterium]